MKLRFALSAAALLAFAACSGKSPLDPFDRDDLASSYDAYADAGNPRWVIANGRLEGVGPANQAVLIRKGVSFKDGWVEAQSTRADDGGLVLRFQNPNDYYLLAFRDDSAPSPRGTLNLAMYHHTGGQYNEMWREDVYWPRGTRHTIRFEAKADTMRAWFDGQMRGEIELSFLRNDFLPYLGPGGVGVRQYGGDSTWISTFDSFRWHGAK
jgi:hypothetical protein